jgi:ferric-dicitrate binding protein FerR (iron transport regulator)
MPAAAEPEPDSVDEETLDELDGVPAVSTMVLSPEERAKLTAREEEEAEAEAPPRRRRRVLRALVLLVLLLAVAVLVLWALR